MPLLRAALFLYAVLAPAGLSAETELELGLLGGRNEGEQIFSTGSKTPDLLGFAGGSRLTYPRNFNYGGFFANLRFAPLEANLRFSTTGWYVGTGTARNEDFTLNQRSTIRDYRQPQLRRRSGPHGDESV